MEKCMYHVQSKEQLSIPWYIEQSILQQKD